MGPEVSQQTSRHGEPVEEQVSLLYSLIQANIYWALSMSRESASHCS